MSRDVGTGRIEGARRRAWPPLVATAVVVTGLVMGSAGTAGGAVTGQGRPSKPTATEPTDEPIYCGATIRSVAVDLSGVTVPPIGTLVDLYGHLTGSSSITAADLEVSS
jgi:hypothetical protein